MQVREAEKNSSGIIYYKSFQNILVITHVFLL